MSDSLESKWKFHGVRVVKGSELDTNTPQTAGMNRAAAIARFADLLRDARRKLI